ncbi:MAG TPA: hypothetical protein VGO17_12010 [Aurantimonas sp.]|jgi:hypothetical protein|nr:hypothetical protein [Aurantimonas sp.]
MSSSVHALICEDDNLVAAFIEGVLLDFGIDTENVTPRDGRGLLLRSHYDVAVVGVDKRFEILPRIVRHLQLHEIPVVFFTVIGEANGVASAFPDIPICRYDPQYSESLALKVWSAASSGSKSAAARSPLRQD